MIPIHQIYDWRLEDGNTPDVDARPWDVTIPEQSSSAIRLNVKDPDGNTRALWIEVEEETLVIHAYDEAHDEPVNMHIGKEHILVTTDRENWN